jgi:phage tail-like protein
MSRPGVKHLLLNKQATWREASLEGTILADDGKALRLRARRDQGYSLLDAAGSFGGLALPTGMAQDGQGRLYLLESQAHLVKRFDPCTREFKVLPCIGGEGSEPRQLRAPRGLAISSRGDLYIADTGNRRVQVFALKGLALRAIWGPLRVIQGGSQIQIERTAAVWSVPKAPLTCKPETLPPPICEARPLFPRHTWEPWDIVLSSTHWAYVSDYANGLVHVFDPCAHWHTAYSQEAFDVRLEKPTHLALDEQGRLHVAQEGKEYVAVFDTEGRFLERVYEPDEVRGRFSPVPVLVDENGNLCLSQCLTQHAYPAGVSCSKHSPHADVCRGVDTDTALVLDRSGQRLADDGAQGEKVCRLKAPALETEGRYYSEPLDSQVYRCGWHRVAIQASIEARTYLQVDTFTSEAPKTHAEILGLPDSRWATGQRHTVAGDGEWDCLIQSPPGRYLWLRLTLFGDGTLTPVVRQIKVYYPRASSLRYLPATYREDAASAGFLDQFLSIFDTIWDGVSDQVTDIAGYFDPAATPSPEPGSSGPDFLSWLASWLGLTLEAHWPLEKRRQLLAKAHRLYALRGTAQGMRMHIQLYTGVEPHILEHYKLRRWLFLDEARLGENSALWGKVVVNRLQLDEHSQVGDFQLIDSQDPMRDPFHYYAHQFTVFIPNRNLNETQRLSLERIVDMSKPAHTRGGGIRLVEPCFRVGVGAFVGLDTVIGRHPRPSLDGEGKLGYDTVLSPAPDDVGRPTMRIGSRIRIGSSTLID